MNEKEFISELGTLQEEILDAKRRIQKIGPKWRQLFDRSAIGEVEVELDGYFERLVAIDMQAIHSLKVPSDINSRIMVSASISILSHSRESTRSILISAYNDISGLRSQLNFYASLGVALVALFVSIAGLAS